MFKKVLQFKIKLFVTIVIALVLIQLSSAYVFGFIIQKQMDAEFKYLTASPLVHVVSHQYNRGIFSSDVITKVSVSNQVLAKVLNMLPNNQAESGIVAQVTSQNYTITYTTHVMHGLFAGALNGYLMPTLAYAKTTVVYPEHVKKLLAKFFNNREPLVITDVLYLDKSGKLSVISSKFDYEEAVSGVKVVWGGMNITTKYNDTFTKFDKRVDIPLFTLSAPTRGKVEFKGLDYHSKQSVSVNGINVGHTNLTLNSVSIDWKDKLVMGFKIGDMLHMLTNISSSEFLNSIDAIDPNSFSFSNVAYTADSSDQDGFFQATADARFATLVTNSKSYGPMEFKISVNHVAAKEFSTLSSQIEHLIAKHEAQSTQTAEQQDQDRQEWIDVLKHYLEPILVAKPVIQLNNFTLQTPDGLVHITGIVSTNNFTPADMNEESQFMQKLAMDINLSVPKPVLSYLFMLQMRYLLGAGSNAQMDEQSAASLNKVVNILLDNQINIWMKKGYITESNGVISTHLELKDGQLTHRI